MIWRFGETRLTTGTMLTDKLFTGQREMAELGIYHYGARFYSPTLGRFLSADTIVPGYANPQNLNRFSYTLNNPLKYTDPTGHWVLETDDPVREQRRNANRHKEERERNRRERNRAYALYHVQSDTNLYQLGWQNFGAAWSIYTNSNATISQRAGAGFYMGAWGGAHAGLVIGGAILAWEAVVPGSMSCIGNPACQQQAANNVQQVADDIGNWLGDDLVAIRNKAGDFILRNAENTRRFRFDYNNPSPHTSPHFHLEGLNSAGEWITTRIFPNDVPPY